MARTRLCRSLALLLAASGLFACAARQPLPDDGFVDVPGGRIAFRVVGGGDEVPVLIIHGGPGGTSCSYVSTVTGMASSRAVVFYDQLGSGNSDRMRDLERDATLPRFVQEVDAIRQELGLAEVHLVGHSWGATVALEYLLTASPTGVRSVTFVGPLLSTPRWIEDANALVGQLPGEVQAAIESVPVRFNAQLYEYMWGPSEFLSTGTLRDYDRLERLSELKLPTLFVVGQYDEVREGTAREFQARVAGSVVRVVPDAGHAVHMDQTQVFNEVISEFTGDAEKR